MLISAIRRENQLTKKLPSSRKTLAFTVDDVRRFPPAKIGVQSPDIKPTTHAWAEVLLPGAGWRGFDATLQLVTDETYVAIAVGRDDQDAAPQRGSFKGEEGSEPPHVSLQIMRQQ